MMGVNVKDETAVEPLLFLAHRLPYPPNKGDKIRSFHLLRYLATRFRIYLATFIDDEEDRRHIDRLSEWCADYCAVRLAPTFAKLRSVSGLFRGEALTLSYYRDPRLRRWIDEAVRAHDIRKAVAFSSSMAQYVGHWPELHVVTDFVDVDSAKWTQYAGERPWPARWIFRREGERLLAFERKVAGRAAATVLVTPAERDLFLSVAPECEGKIESIQNGVDCDYFAPAAARPSPYRAEEAPVVFTGAMDYWPNVDAVLWFAREVLPSLREQRPDVCFYIVGMNPAPPVRALAANAGIVVTGKVADVRPYVQHAGAVVAPLRIARGVQNKVLEAMAMARPVVVSSVAARGIEGLAGHDFESAGTPVDYVAALLRALDAETGRTMGDAARACVQANYNWDRNLAAFTRLLDQPPRVSNRRHLTPLYA